MDGLAAAVQTVVRALVLEHGPGAGPVIQRAVADAIAGAARDWQEQQRQRQEQERLLQAQRDQQQREQQQQQREQQRIQQEQQRIQQEQQRIQQQQRERQQLLQEEQRIQRQQQQERQEQQRIEREQQQERQEQQRTEQQQQRIEQQPRLKQQWPPQTGNRPNAASASPPSASPASSAASPLAQPPKPRSSWPRQQASPAAPAAEAPRPSRPPQPASASSSSLFASSASFWQRQQQSGPSEAARIDRTPASTARPQQLPSPQGSLCTVCSKSVFPRERALGLDVPCHTTCFRCASCSSTLSQRSFGLVGGRMFCPAHLQEANEQAANQMVAERDPAHTRTCAICDTPRAASWFAPELCAHVSSVCVECCSRHVQAQLQDGVFEVSCVAQGAGCRWRGEEIQLVARFSRLVPPDAAVSDTAVAVAMRQLRTQRYLQLPYFRWCRNPACEDCMVGTPDRPRMECSSCGLYTCLNHEDVDHVGETCAQYDERTRLQRAAEEQASVGMVNNGIDTKPCPRCHANIYKDGGCRHMTCRCGHEFFWCCLRAYRDPAEARLHNQQC